MHTYARIHTRVELKLAAWEEDKARGCVNSLLVSVAKKDLSFEQNGEKGRERKRERERETKTRISRDISNSLGQICRLFVLEAAIQRERESARAFLTRLCVQIYAPRVHRAFRSSVPGILSLPLSRRLLDARD